MDYNITDFIPHRSPFIMIDSVESIQENGATTTFSIRKDHIFCEGGIFKSSGIIENIAQTAAAFAGYTFKDKNLTIPLGFIASVKGLEIFRLPKVGELITTTVSKVDEVMDFDIFEGEVYCNEITKIAHCELRIFTKKREGDVSQYQRNRGAV